MRCDHCPCVGPCFGERHRRVCDLRDPAHPARDPAYDAPMPGEDGYAPDPPPPPPIERPAVPLGVGLAVVQCTVRGAPLTCGCAEERRYCGETFDQVTFAACVACQQNTAGPTP